MADWANGYIKEIGYTFGYYSELNPMRIKLAFLSARLAAPKVGAACELGFGQGMSVNLHASASVTKWYGTDFNPAQAGHAQEVARQAANTAQLYDESFAEFCRRDDLPDFDYIAMHGIWSWISDENRDIIVDFIRRKLKVGGVLYISYNTQPGWAPMIPIRNLMTQYSEVMSAPGAAVTAKVDDALAFVQKMLNTEPLYAKANPQVAERVKRIATQNRAYLAHEYFNRDWTPMSFSEMAKRLEPAKIDFACSATLTDHIDAINLKEEQLALINSLPDPVFRETIRDFMTNQQFRRDYWVKGRRTLNKLEYSEALRALRVVLAAPRESIVLKLTGALGEAALVDTVYKPIIELLSDFKIRTVAEIEAALAPAGINLPQIEQACLALVSKAAVNVAQDSDAITASRPHTNKMNAYLLNRARGSGDVSLLVSPYTGDGLTVDRFQQLFVLARANGHKQPADWAQFAWNLLKAQGEALLKDGAALAGDEANLAELVQRATEFREKRLPQLVALGVV